MRWTVVTQDDGRVWLYCSNRSGTQKALTHLCLVNGSVMLAQGSFSEFGCLSPDGMCFLTPTAVAAVTVADGKIALGKWNHCKTPFYLRTYGLIGSYNCSSIYAGGVVMSSDCTVYDTAGRIKRPAPGWVRDETVSPGSRYTLLLKDNQVRAYSPTTGDSWQFHPRGFTNRGGDITDDGRFVMLWCEREFPAFIQPLLDSLDIEFGLRQEYLVFFERPGRMRALCRQPRRWSSWWISPDGHTVVAQEITEDISLYRW